MSPRYFELIFPILSPFFSSISTIFLSQATKILHPLLITSVGGILGALILLLSLSFQKKKLSLKNIKNNYRKIFIMALLRPLFGQLLLVYGLSLTTGIKAIFFTKTEPYFVLLWYWIIKKEKIRSKYLILLAIHILGALILSTGGNFMINKPQVGDFLIILAMGLFSLSYFYGKTLANNVGPQVSNAITLGIGGIILLPFTFVIKPFPYTFAHPTGWLYFLVFVFLFNVIGLTFWFSSLKNVPAWIVSSLRSIGPLVGAPVAYLIFGETLSKTQLLGGAIVLLTSFLIAREHLIS